MSSDTNKSVAQRGGDRSPKAETPQSFCLRSMLQPLSKRSEMFRGDTSGVPNFQTAEGTRDSRRRTLAD